MVRVILGGEAVAAGWITRHALRTSYRKVFRGVYAANDGELTLRGRAIAAWLATRRKGVIAGQTAAALHGASWVDVTQPIEVAGASCGPQEGLVLRTESIADDEITSLAGLPVTTRVRTAYDVGRHLDRGDALARLDALMWDRPFSVEDVADLARRYPRAPGSRQLRELLTLVDGGAATPSQSRVRLALIDAGCPRPQTQLPVLVGSQPVAYLDIGWPEYRVAVVCGAEDVAQQRMLESLGWIVVWVGEGERLQAWLARVEAALACRGYFVETTAAA
ncbi:hypothetical protein [Mycobacterium sp. 852002-51961_SCH5331710]|uniref:hypothetical protein n=1 Tax=Mycobacterium sp. 852002-51961_SCH5331710 TaxID=1834105 RepID=UPI000801515D|nr:hypothetical protein [Mycobacterium sp. 852002-51961_SCH5331710]OBB48448.1 hypothetical protein A5752_21295 [Mycobacterium sp. 852002-51961_SCH5331710]